MRKIAMILENESQVTEAVLRAMAATPNPRLREVMSALVRHLHSFAREVRPTEAEFEFGLQVLNAIGQATNDSHNEAVLYSDIIGLSTLVGLLNNPIGPGHTAAALLGPFWRLNAPHCANGDTIARSETPGLPLFVSGRVTDSAGKPVAGANVDVWQASPVGLYEIQDPNQDDMNLRGLFTTDADGRYWFRSVKPAGYPVPVHGPGGDLLRAQLRHPYRPAHVHFMVSAFGYKTLVTQVFADDDEQLENDVTFSVIGSLIGKFVRHEDGSAPAPDVTPPFCTLAYDLVIEPGESRLPAPPIR
jgi:protocatechuate 3,4-dioxygenase beta subunit